VQITLNGTDANFCDWFVTGFDEQGFDYVDACLHCPCRNQHFGNKYFPPRELLANLPEGGDHGLIEDLPDICTVVHGLSHEFDHAFALTEDNCVEKIVIDTHGQIACLSCPASVSGIV
jgi:hypothetical protein